MEFKLMITASPELLSVLGAIVEALDSKVSMESQIQTKEVGGNIGQVQPQISQGLPNSQVPVTNNQAQVNQIPTNVQPGIPNPMGAVPVANMQNNNIPAPITQPQSGTQIPTGTQSYTMDQLAVAATQLVDAGRRNDLVNLLSSFGVQALTSLPKEQYGNFATQLRAMGARI